MSAQPSYRIHAAQYFAIEADTEAVGIEPAVAIAEIDPFGSGLQYQVYLLLRRNISIKFPGEVVPRAAFEYDQRDFRAGIAVDEIIHGAITADKPGFGKTDEGDGPVIDAFCKKYILPLQFHFGCSSDR